MLEWFNNLNVTVQGAIFTAIATVLCAVIRGVFALIKKDRIKQNNTKVKQKQRGRNNTQIGIQNNYRKGDKDDA